jgi:tripartite-type tricarboxylate transporter receptor subunit TctC
MAQQIRAAWLVSFFVLATPLAWSQAYPVKPVRILVPAAPGGGVDIMARMLGKELSAALGQPFVIENRSPFIPGVEAVAKAAPDGHVLLLTTATYLVNGALHRNLPYDPIKSLTPVSLLGKTPIIVTVHPSLPATSLSSLAALARKMPGQLNFGSGGNGSALHLAGELFKQLAKIDMTHVPYRGTAPAAFDLLAGHIHVMFPSVVSMNPHIKAGKVRVLAVLSERRSPVLPNVATSVEAGFRELIANIWFGFLAPRNTSKPIVDRLHAEVVKAFSTPEIKERLAMDAVEPVASTPEEFARYTVAELQKWSRVIRAANIVVE